MLPNAQKSDTGLSHSPALLWWNEKTAFIHWDCERLSFLQARKLCNCGDQAVWAFCVAQGGACRAGETEQNAQAA